MSYTARVRLLHPDLDLNGHTAIDDQHEGHVILLFYFMLFYFAPEKIFLDLLRMA